MDIDQQHKHWFILEDLFSPFKRGENIVVTIKTVPVFGCQHEMKNKLQSSM